MRPIVSWRLLIILIVLAVLAVLWWPKGEKSAHQLSISCLQDSLYEKVLLRDRQRKDSLFRVAPTSPIPPESREAFRGLGYYPVSAAWCLKGRYEAQPGALLPVIGRIRLALPTLDSCKASATLIVYGDAHGQNPYVAFWDSTAMIGETYENGRYVPIQVQGDSAIVDFNRAYFPFCAYNPNYICEPYPPTNRFCMYIRAGEKHLRYATP